MKVKSILLTEFLADGALIDIKTEKVIIKIEVEEEEEKTNKVENTFERTTDEYPPPEITSIKISRIEKDKPIELPIAKKTGRRFVCAGQTIQIDLTAINLPDNITLQFEGDTSINTLDELTKKFEWDEPKSRKVKTRYATLNALRNQYRGILRADVVAEYENGSKDFRIIYVVPYGTKQTLHSWSTLREISKDAFNIDETRLFSRIRNPYKLVFKVSGVLGATTTRVSLDVFERWDTLYNRDLTPYIRK